MKESLNIPRALSSRSFSGDRKTGRCVFFGYTAHCCKRFRNKYKVLYIYIYITMECIFRHKEANHILLIWNINNKYIQDT